MKIAGFVPAKSTSTRLKDKNSLLLGGVPLYINAAMNLSKVLPREDIYIDSDSKEFLSVAINLGFGTILRPKAFADNSFDGNDLMRWEISQVECDIEVQHLPTMPFLKKQTIEKAVEAVKNGYDSILACYYDHFYTWDDQGPQYDLKNLPNSFELKKTCIEGMGFYVTRREFFTKEEVRVGGKMKEILLSKFEQCDINYVEDYELAKALSVGWVDG